MKAARKVRRWRPVAVETDGLELRPLAAGDVEAFLDSIDDEVRRWQGYDDRAVAAYGKQCAVMVRAPGMLPLRLLALVRDGRFVGYYVLTSPSRRRDWWDVELGWWLASEARGQGLGWTSLAAVLRYVHRSLGLPVARMGTDIDNIRAVRQIEAAGAVPVHEGEHKLPDGRVVVGRWYHHEER